MANILALEAASESCSVTLRTPEFEKSLEIDEARSHSKHFLPLIHALLDEHSMTLGDITFIACGNGPGSFTGLRICFSMAQGLAFGLNIPLLTVSSLESMAHFYKTCNPGQQQRALSILDARMKEVYLGEFDLNPDPIQRRGPLQLLDVESAQQYVSKLLEESEGVYALLGAGAELLGVPQRLEHRLVLHKHVLPHSSSVAQIALQRWLGGEASSADAAEICYLRNSVSWDKRKRIRAGSADTP